MITQNLHMHSTWDDGKCSIEEMILASKAAGLTSVGFSVHCPMPFENTWECPLEKLPDYIAEVRAMQAKYAGIIDVYLGIEWDTTAQGLDLSGYVRKNVKRYTYTVENYKNQDITVYANVIVYRHRVIGGDICSAEITNGFVQGFEKK